MGQFSLGRKVVRSFEEATGVDDATGDKTREAP
jgi:hypothetical protein